MTWYYLTTYFQLSFMGIIRTSGLFGGIRPGNSTCPFCAINKQMEEYIPQFVCEPQVEKVWPPYRTVRTGTGKGATTSRYLLENLLTLNQITMSTKLLLVPPTLPLRVQMDFKRTGTFNRMWTRYTSLLSRKTELMKKQSVRESNSKLTAFPVQMPH